MRHSLIKFAITVGLGVGLSILALWLPASRTAHAGTPITVCLTGDCDYTTIQAAVDAAAEGTTIKIAAGHYTQRNTYNGLTQVVYLNKTVTLRGGYTTTNWAAPNPAANPTILDAQNQGRVVYITGQVSPTLQGLFLTGGNAAGLRGGPADNEDAGGGIYITAAQATLIHNRIFSNTARLGGGVFLANDQSRLNDNYIATNTAGAGAGLYLYHSNANLTGNTIITNTALTYNLGAGGGLYLDASQSTLTENTISANATNWHGGGLYIAGSAATLTDNLISANTVGFCGGGVRLQNSAAILTGNTIISNSAGYQGGGVEFDHSPATLTGNTIVNNTAKGSGGGLYVESSQATFNRNTVQTNTSGGSGGGISLVNSSDMLINNIIADNQAASRGSGLYLANSSPRLWHTTIAHNIGGDGSGLYADLNASPNTVTFINTILVSHTVGITVARGNTVKLDATLWGGGTWANLTDWQGAGVILTGTHNLWGNPDFTCANNRCSAPYHLGSTSAAIDAGVETDTPTDIDGEARPTAFGADLGADELPGAGLRLAQSASTLLLKPGQTVTYTLLVTAAGTPLTTGLWLADTLPALQQAASVATDRGQCLVRWGGKVLCNLGVITPGDSARITLAAQVTTTPTVEASGLMRNTIQVRGVTASNTNSLETRLQSCRVQLNHSPVDYSTIQAAVDASTQPDDVLKLAGYCAGVSTRAGVTQTVYLSKTLTIQGGWNFAFTRRNVVSYPTTIDAQGQGRVFYITGNTSPTITGLQLTGGNAAGLGGFVNPESPSQVDDAGGGVYVLTASVTLDDNSVFNNTANRGGGMFLGYSKARLTANVVSSNTAGVKGGGIYLLKNDQTELSRNTVSGNTANEAGGGIFLVYSNAQVKDNLISANTAKNGSGVELGLSQVRLTGNTITHNMASERGGGVHLQQSNATIQSNRVITNMANEGGGFYLTESSATLSDNTIEANNALAGGGGVYLYTSNALLNKNVIQANIAEGSGGGALLDWSNARLDWNLLTHNQAGYGGGIYVWGGAPAFNGTVISENTALGGGGGVSMLYGEPTFSNTLIVDNRADVGGGGLWIEGSTPRLLHTTIARNHSGDGSGVYVTYHYDSKSMYNSYVEMVNTILVSHTMGITVTPRGKVKLENTLWGAGEWANGTDWGVSESPDEGLWARGVVITGGKNLWVDPGFTCAGADCAQPYHLTSVSPARDAAGDIGVKEDIDGQRRPMGQGNDLGADEITGPGLDLSQQLSDHFLNPDQNLTSTIVITSVGSNQAANTVLTTTLGTWQRITGIGSSTGNCAVVATGDPNTVTCRLGTLSPGQRAVVTVTATVSDTVSPGQAMPLTTTVKADGAGNLAQIITYGQDCHARLNNNPLEYTTVQAAVDAAQPGDWVKVAGFCAGANKRNEISAQVYLDKHLTLQGGYTQTHWLTSDPGRYPTTLDALGLGGVLYVGGKITPTIDGFYITGGRATYGGGVNLAYDSLTTLRRNTIIGNSADYGGGVAANWSQAWLVNNIIAANQARTTGSGLYIIDSKVDMRQTTIAQNTGGDVSGLYIGYGATWGLRGSDVTMKNTILVSHTVGITLGVGHKMPVMEATLWGNDSAVNKIEGGYGDDNTLGTLNRQGNPAFVAPERGDYHLARASAARDTGVDAGVKDDRDGHPRPVGAGYDLGAFEYPGLGLDIAQWSSDHSINPGQVFTYTTIITSIGNTAVGAILTHTLDAGQQPVAAATSVGKCAIASGEVTCRIETLNNGQRITATLIVQAAATVKVGQEMTHTTTVAALDAIQRVRTNTYGQDCHVRLDDTPNSGAEYPNIQAAVDVARPGDLLKVAGICVGARERYGTYQQIYLDKSVTLQGGYSFGRWAAPDPTNFPTTLDALGQGRVFYITGTPTVRPTITGFRITGSGAVEMGGGMYIISATAVVSNNQVFGNRATNGGGIYLADSAAILRGNTVFTNVADFGGGIYADNSKAILTGNQVMSNTATNGGGGIKLQDSPAILTENRVISNTAKVYGGGLDLWASDATLSGNIIADNAAVGSVASYGGGLHFFKSLVTLTENLVIANTAGESGGGLGLWESQATLTGNTITTNTAVLGGGVMLDESAAVLERNLIAANGVSYKGGGIYADNSKVILTHNTLTANQARVTGGGLSLDMFSPATVNGNTISFNSSDWGGGMGLDDNSTVWIINSIIANNQSRGGGSALYLTRSSANLVHTTVAHNTGGDGSGISLNKYGVGVSFVVITNTIMVSHAVGIKVTENCTATLNGVLWGYDPQANQKETDGLGTVINGQNNIQGDPGFSCTGDTCATLYHLGSASAARDAGVETNVTVDIDGDPRPQGRGYDIGADEVK